MTKAVSFRRSDVAGPPQDDVWVWHSLTLLRSDAWRGRSVPLSHLLDFLEIAHLQNAGLENGNLYALYDDLVRFGVGRRHIAGALKEGVRRGLVAITQAGRSMEDGLHLPSLYRLTYLPTRKTLANGATEWTAPTNEWRRFKKTKTQYPKVHPSECTKVNLVTM